MQAKSQNGLLYLQNVNSKAKKCLSSMVSLIQWSLYTQHLHFNEEEFIKN